MTNFRKTVCLLILLGCFSIGSVRGDISGLPITGERYDSYLKAQDLKLQSFLEKLFPEREGYFVTGPLDPFFDGDSSTIELYRSVRVICPDLELLETGYDRIINDTSLAIIKHTAFIHNGRMDRPFGYRGVLIYLEIDGAKKLIQLNTVQQTRWLLWAHGPLHKGNITLPPERINAYAEAVSSHLYTVERHWDDIMLGSASSYGLTGLLDTLDLYRPPPDYVISGYKNYKDFLARHRSVYTDYASGLIGFIPSDSLIKAMIKKAPRTVWPNKESRMLQLEYQKFFARGGEMGVIRTLTKEIFDSLPGGEYFFAVGPSGKIRFGRELLREEVAKIEVKTGKKVPRANHAFLFHGLPLLTAGAFFVERDSVTHIIEVNAQSGHYFYSNVSKSIKEDIKVRSNSYIATLGHLFVALDKLKIRYDDILIRKM